MAVVYYLPQFATSSLNVPGNITAIQTSGIILTSVPDDIDITKPGILCLTYANPLDTDTAEWVTYTSISGTNELQGVTRAQEGFTGKIHLNGAVVAWPISKSHINNINDKLTGVDAVLATDVHGNEVIKTAHNDSAVNELTATNAATGNAPEVSATGGDTNIDLKLSPKGTGDVDLGGGAAVNIQVANADPKRGLYIPANALFPATTTGCASSAQVESSSNKINYKVLDFDKDTEEYAFFVMPAPSFWDLGTVTAEFHWTAASGTGDVVWGIAGVAIGNDDALDAALGTAVTVTDTLITAEDEHLSPDTAAITLAGTPAKDDYLFFRVHRKAADAADTLSVDARLIGVTIRFGMAQYNDA